jgi:hypothetical protein
MSDKQKAVEILRQKYEDIDREIQFVELDGFMSGMLHLFLSGKKPFDTELITFLVQNENHWGRSDITFLKKDGTKRRLFGNIDADTKRNKFSSPIKTSEGWRAFRLDSVLKMQVVISPVGISNLVDNN